MVFLFDLGLESMTLILKLDLDMVKMYLYTEMKFLAVQKLQTDRQTDWTEIIIDMHTW